MKTKLKKLVFSLSKNSRITTKQLSKELMTSQQSASYILKTIKKKHILQNYATIVDAVKLGYTNVLVGINFLDFENKKEVIDLLKQTESVLHIQKCKLGVDLLVEFSSHNLSSFNKTHTEIMKQFRKSLETKFIFPIIVKHKFHKNYLTRKQDTKDNILCGDREIRTLTEKEWLVLNELVRNPNSTFTLLTQKTKLAVKTIVAIKKRLERTHIIKGYSCSFNLKKLGIKRYVIFLKFASGSYGDLNKIVEFAKTNKNIVELSKIIGTHDVVLTIEELKETNLISDLRKEFSIDEYFIVEVNNFNKTSYFPLKNTGENS